VSDKVKNPIRMVFEEGNINMFLNTSLGSAKDSCSCEGNAENVEIGFNHKYLIDAFKAALPDERVSIKLNSALSPCIITPEDNDSFLFMVLPVRLKS
jgi:DNA polymerase-3 subunit beta